jgi:hypothetical protein
MSGRWSEPERNAARRFTTALIGNKKTTLLVRRDTPLAIVAGAKWPVRRMASQLNLNYQSFGNSKPDERYQSQISHVILPFCIACDETPSTELAAPEPRGLRLTEVGCGRLETRIKNPIALKKRPERLMRRLSRQQGHRDLGRLLTRSIHSVAPASGHDVRGEVTSATPIALMESRLAAGNGWILDQPKHGLRTQYRHNLVDTDFGLDRRRDDVAHAVCAPVWQRGNWYMTSRGNVPTDTICAVICGADDFVAIAQLGRTKRKILGEFIDLVDGGIEAAVVWREYPTALHSLPRSHPFAHEARTA